MSQVTMMSSFKVAFLFSAVLTAVVCLQASLLSVEGDAQGNALVQLSTDSSGPTADYVTVPQTDGKDVVHVRVYTVPVGEDHYTPYGGVRGTFSRDGRIVSEFVTDERGEFTIYDLPAGDWEIMAEQERDEVFGVGEVTISYDVFHEDTLIIFLNRCGLARFPNEFDPSLPLAENKVKYWQYVNCAGVGPETPQDPNAPRNSASDAYATAQNTCCQTGYDACNACDGCCQPGCGNGFGALGLLGLLGLIGLAHPVPPVSLF